MPQRVDCAVKTNRIAPPHQHQPNFSAAESAFLAAAVEDGIRILPRFRPEPLLARTGRGFMAPSGIEEIAARRQPHTLRK